MFTFYENAFILRKPLFSLFLILLWRYEKKKKKKDTFISNIDILQVFPININNIECKSLNTSFLRGGVRVNRILKIV